MKTENRRLRVLVVAAAAHPGKGSEPGLGWAWITALSKRADVWAVIGEREENRKAIEEAIKEGETTPSLERLCFVPLGDGPRLARLFPPLYYRDYRRWHERAFEQAKVWDDEVDFDVVHQLNMMGFREPGFIWSLGKPFVWGPIGGVENLPLRFASVLGFWEAMFQTMKVVVNEFQLRFHPRVRKAADRASALISGTSGTREKILRVWGRDSVVIPGPGPSLKPAAAEPAGGLVGNRLTMAWSGLHVSRKGLPLVLRALARVPPTCDWQLEVLGDGPMRKRWQREAERLGIAPKCRWRGWLPKREAQKIVAAADLFVFPTLHDAVSTVVIEALEAGVPVVGLSHCGLEDVVNADSGVLIEPRGPRWVIGELARVIERAAKDRGWLKALGRNAARSVEEMGWEGRAAVVVNLYERAAQVGRPLEHSARRDVMPSKRSEE